MSNRTGLEPLPASALPVDLDLIQRLLALMEEGGLTELEWRNGDTRVRLSKRGDPPVAAAAAVPAQAAAPAAGGLEGPEDEPGILAFRSPMVGTFYRAASPESEPFVHAGDRVGPESVLCILEAMKVMNEIKAECSGEVLEVLVENGEPVEFGQPLFRIRTA